MHKSIRIACWKGIFSYNWSGFCRKMKNIENYLIKVYIHCMYCIICFVIIYNPVLLLTHANSFLYNLSINGFHSLLDDSKPGTCVYIFLMSFSSFLLQITQGEFKFREKKKKVIVLFKALSKDSKPLDRGALISQSYLTAPLLNSPLSFNRMILM